VLSLTEGQVYGPNYGPVRLSEVEHATVEARIREAAERIHTVRPVALMEDNLGLGLAHDLEEARHEASGEVTAEAYAVTMGEGYGTGATVTALVFPSARRAGVCLGGNPEWTDVDTAAGGKAAAREAVARYLAGEMVL
jgi:hypothetical protein